MKTVYIRLVAEKWSLAKLRILWNAYICLWRYLRLIRFRKTVALIRLIYWCFAGFFSSFQYWFHSPLLTFITGTCFESYCSILLLKLFHLIFIACQFTEIWVWRIIEQIIKKLYLTPTSEMPSFV